MGNGDLGIRNLPSDVAARILGMVFRWEDTEWSLMDFRCGDIPLDMSAVGVAARILGLLADASLRSVSRSWRSSINEMCQQWPSRALQSLQLHGVQHVPPLPQIIRTLASVRRDNILYLRGRLESHMWPAHLTSIQIGTPGGDVTMDPQSWFNKLGKPFAAFAYALFEDVPLPWMKCMGGVAHIPDSVPATDGFTTSGGRSIVYQNFLHDTYGQGVDSLHSSAEVLVGPGGPITRSGSSLESRFPSALAKLRQDLGGQAIDLVSQKVVWSESIRQASTARVRCSLVAMGIRTLGECNCIRCKDTRSWSYLTYGETFEFSYQLAGTTAPVQIFFEWKGRVLPFLASSVDSERRREARRLMSQIGWGPQDDERQDTEDESDDSAELSEDDEDVSDGSAEFEPEND